MRTRLHAPSRSAAVCIAGLLACAGAQAYLVSIDPANRAIYLQVGSGTYTGVYNGGTPGNNSTVNLVSTTVAANAIGAGPQTMGTDSSVTASSYDGFPNYCATGSGQTYVGGFYRTGGTGANGTLSVTTPANLINAAGDTLPFGTISWVSGGRGDTTPTIPGGTFVGGTTQTVFTVARNNWFESCLTFSYANANMVAAGTFTGRATYTLVAP